MTGLAATAGDFLRGRGPFAAGAPVAGRIRRLFLLVVVGGGLYGAVMGSFAGLEDGRQLQLAISAAKVPLLLVAAFLLGLPSFYVLHLVAGVGDDFPRALRAVVATQSAIALVLLGLAPLTAFFYVAFPDYGMAVAFNGLAFLVGSLTAVAVVRRYYGPLIREDRRHAALMAGWFLLYIFVGIQMAWVLRPFVGAPGAPVRFFRPDAWGNAYEVVLDLLHHSFLRATR